MLNGKNAITVDQLSFIIDAENNPEKIFNINPNGMYKKLVDLGFDVKPLGRGSLAGKSFTNEGGGYCIYYGGNGYMQYHPITGSHHGSEYYKISNVNTGITGYNIDGTVLYRRGGNV